MVCDLIPDPLWEQVEPLLPHPPRRRRYPGRRRADDRAVLAGIVFVLGTGTAWNQLPLGVCGYSGVTCWRRLREWTEAGAWPALSALLTEFRPDSPLGPAAPRGAEPPAGPH